MEDNCSIEIYGKSNFEFVRKNQKWMDSKISCGMVHHNIAGYDIWARIMQILNFVLRGEIRQHFWAGAEGRKLVLGRLRAVAVGSFFSKFSSKEIWAKIGNQNNIGMSLEMCGACGMVPSGIRSYWLSSPMHFGVVSTPSSCKFSSCAISCTFDAAAECRQTLEMCTCAHVLNMLKLTDHG